MFGLGKLFYTIVLAVNGIAVLSEDRFLNRIGWGLTTAGLTGSQYQHQFNAGITLDNASVKTRLINLISAVRTLLRVPLIAVNLLLIVYLLLLG